MLNLSIKGPTFHFYYVLEKILITLVLTVEEFFSHYRQMTTIYAYQILVQYYYQQEKRMDHIE
jgi:hypothetical protein